MMLPEFNKQATLQFLNESLNDFANTLPVSARRIYGEVATVHMKMLEAELSKPVAEPAVCSPTD